MSVKSITESLNLFLPYYVDPSTEFMSADHDEIHLPATDRPMSHEDVKKVKELGWFQPDAAEDEDSDAADAEYNPEYAWQRFV